MSDTVATTGSTTTAEATPSIDSAVAEASSEMLSTENNFDPSSEGSTQLSEVAEAAEQALNRKFKVKVDNQETEVDESELIAGYQRAKAAAKRFEDAAKMKKEAEQLAERLKKNPRDVLKNAGIDLKQFSEEVLNEFIEEESLTPEEKKSRDLERRLREYEDKEKKINEAKEQEEHAKLLKQYEDDYTKNITTALETSGLPKTPYTVKRMAQYMARALDQGIEVDAKDVVAYVKEDYMNDIKQLFSSSNADLLTQLLGKENTDKLRKAELAKVKQKTAPAPTQTQQVAKAEPVEKKPSKKLSVSEWRERMLKGDD